MIKILAVVLLAACTTSTSKDKKTETMVSAQTSQSIHEFKVPSIDGGTIDFGAFKGKKVLVVNTASECGYTRQYEGLQKLYEENKEKLVIVGFPANDFGKQEPGANEEIKEFCKAKFGVTFPLAAKVAVTGEEKHPLFKWLTSREENGVMDAEIKWNFTKFLLDEEGKLVATFPSKVEPISEDILQYLK